jgi:hypothetical protein
MSEQPGFSQAQQQICSNCSASFTCGATIGGEACWCNDLPHILPVTAKDEDCLFSLSICFLANRALDLKQL